MVARVFIRSSMPVGLVRVPHGWWKPESAGDADTMSSLWAFADAQLTADDDPDLIDREQGIPHMKGVPCRVTALTATEVDKLEATFGPTDRLPKGPEGKVMQFHGEVPDFMADEEFGEGVEFEAIELSLYARASI